jgi:hypothetical protein
MKKIFLFVLIALFSGGSVLNAQNTGFAGKRVLLKTNVINGLYGFCNSYAAEVAFHRKMTITIGYDAINTSVHQSYDPAETVGNNVTINSKAQTSYKGANIEFRKYFSREKPAPYGFFISLNYSNGVLDIEKGHFDERLFLPDGNGIITYTNKGITVNKLGIGLGYQKAINKWIFIGGQISTQYCTFSNILSGIPSNVSSGVVKNYGSNLYNFNIINPDKPIHEQQNKSFGLNGVIQIGIILF